MEHCKDYEKLKEEVMELRRENIELKSELLEIKKSVIGIDKSLLDMNLSKTTKQSPRHKSPGYAETFGNNAGDSRDIDNSKSSL